MDTKKLDTRQERGIRVEKYHEENGLEDGRLHVVPMYSVFVFTFFAPDVPKNITHLIIVKQTRQNHGMMEQFSKRTGLVTEICRLSFVFTPGPVPTV